MPSFFRGTRVPLLGAIAILMAPNLVAAFWCPDLNVKTRLLGVVFALGLLLLPAALAPTRWLLWLSLPLAVMAPFESFHIVMVGAPSTPGMIGSLFETNPREAFELGAAAWGMLFLAFLVPAGQLALVLARRHRPLVPLPRTLARGLLVVGLLSLSLEAIHILRLPLAPRWKRMAASEEFKRTFPFGLLWKASSVAEQKLHLSMRRYRTRTYAWDPVSLLPDTTSRTYVVVVGEASRAGSWSLYGYHRPTSPLMEADTSLLVFRDVTAGANVTFESVAQLFSPATPQDPDLFASSSSLLSCFRQAGFATWWLSMQSPFGISDGKPTMIGREADFHRFVSTDFQDEEATPYDSLLLPMLEQALRSDARRKLIVLHTLGSHFRYEKRYPSHFARIPVSDGALRDTYDNSIAYTDWFLDQVLRRLRAHPGERAFAFISDHGEALGEAGLQLHANPTPAKAEVEVPFFLWLSPEVEAGRPALVTTLRAHLGAKANSSDFAPTLLEIAGLRSERLDSSRNLARSTYRERRRWVRSASGDLLDADLLEGSSLAGQRTAFHPSR